MSIKMTTSFSIETNRHERSNMPYGPKYAGAFNIRRPSQADRNNAETRQKAILGMNGKVDFDDLSEWTKMSTYIACLVNIIATEKLPEWFDLNNIYDEKDEDALLEVWEEVGKFLDTFRFSPYSNSSQPSSEHPPVLVPENI